MLHDAAEDSSPARSACTLGFDEPLAHQIEAGADIFLMPSQYEPSGLNQLYSLQVRHAAGGARDRRPGRHGGRRHAGDPGRRHGHRLPLHSLPARALLQTIERALESYRHHPKTWAQLPIRRHASGLVLEPQRRGV